MVEIHFPSFIRSFRHLNTEIAGQPDGLPCMPSLLPMPLKLLLGEQLVPALLAADVVIPGVIGISVICDEVVIFLKLIPVIIFL